ncbi:MAG: hypothetical protein KGH79_00925 [Patescibacteria group bacterium]|nr:hypothetical protein [Patescibacteria group bacterium]
MNKTAQLILRLSVAFAFLYPPIDALFDPYSWIGYFPPFLRGIVPDLVLLHGFGIIEVIIALWILSNYKIFIPAVLAALMLATIVFFNWPEFQVLFRDMSIALAALALAVDSYKTQIPAAV